MVVLKRLDDALRAGDPIRGIIRNTAIGQDGKTAGITLPSRIAQQDLITSAYRAVSLDPAETGYIEAHGTGTVKGDMIELEALQQAFCKGRGEEKPLYVGSIKGNVGHLEATSGLAGLIKSLLVLEKGLIPPTANLETVKENLKFAETSIKVRK